MRTSETPESADQVLTLPISSSKFPIWTRGKKVTVTGMTVYAPEAGAQVVSLAAVLVSPVLLHRLVHSRTPGRVVLFGSRARSLASPGSDIGLLFVGVWSMEPAHVLRHARHLVMHSFPRVNLVFCTPEDIAAAQTGHAPFLRSILESGVVIYQP